MMVSGALIFRAVGGVSSPAPPPSAGNSRPRVKAAEEDQRPQPKTTAAEEEDYAIWDPAPYIGGGGYGAPIPHAKDACTSRAQPARFNNIFNST